MRQPFALDCLPSSSFKERVDLWGRGDEHFWKGSWPTWMKGRMVGLHADFAGVMAPATESQKLSWPPHAPAHIHIHTLNTGIQSHFKRSPNGVSWVSIFMPPALLHFESFCIWFFPTAFPEASTYLELYLYLPNWRRKRCLGITLRIMWVCLSAGIISYPPGKLSHDASARVLDAGWSQAWGQPRLEQDTLSQKQKQWNA